MFRVIFLVMITSVSPILSFSQETPMTNERIGRLIGRVAQITKEGNGYWELLYKKRVLVVVTDEQNNRMKIMTPVIEKNRVKKKSMSEVMEANFQSALDAKYATYQEFLWSIYTHPLVELYDEQFVDALDQVHKLAINYGSSYSSTYLKHRE